MPTATASVSLGATKGEVLAFFRWLVAAIAGQQPDYGGIVQRLKIRVGNAVLSKIHEDFLVKMLGGVGSDGIQWQQLKAATVKKKGHNKILFEQGDLEKSLRPGVDDQPSGAPGQTLDTSGPAVKVGTSEKPWHHKGTRKLPARPLWPDDLPQSYLDAISEAFREGIALGIVQYFGG
jgi:hypothetical protein